MADITLTGDDLIQFMERNYLGQLMNPSRRNLKTAAGIVDNPNFRKWFDGSKVVDAQGQPLRCYHGTRSGEDFEEFSVEGPPYDASGEPLASGSGADPTAYLGAHFAQEPRIAGQFAMPGAKDWQKYRYDENQSPRIIPVYLRITNPKDFGSEHNLRAFIYQGKVGGYGGDELLNEAMKADGLDPEGLDETSNDADVQEWLRKYDSDVAFRAEQNEWMMERSDTSIEDRLESAQDLASEARQKLVSQGHDGIRYKNEIEGGISWIVFEPNQVKSALGNAGAFDPNNPSMVASKTAGIGGNGWAIWEGHVLLNPRRSAHVDWFEKLGLPTSGPEFDQIPRGNFFIDNDNETIQIWTDSEEVPQNPADADEETGVWGYRRFEMPFAPQEVVEEIKRKHPQARDYEVVDEMPYGSHQYFSASKNAAGEWWRRWRKTVLLKKGTILYHGTAEAFPASQLETPAWFSTSRSVAEHFQSWHGGDEGKFRLLEFKVIKPIRLPRIDGKEDLDRLEEMFGLESSYGVEQILDTLPQSGLQGWIIPHNYPDGDDIMLADSYSIAFVKETPEGKDYENEDDMNEAGQEAGLPGKWFKDEKGNWVYQMTPEEIAERERVAKGRTGSPEALGTPLERKEGAFQKAAETNKIAWKEVNYETPKSNLLGGILESDQDIEDWAVNENVREPNALLRLLTGKRVGVIDHMHIDKESRGQGLGNTLLERFTRQALRERCDALLLEAGIFEPNAPAVRGDNLVKWYERHGFQVIGYAGVSVDTQGRVKLEERNLPVMVKWLRTPKNVVSGDISKTAFPRNQIISPQQARDRKLFGPVWHGTTPDTLKIIETEGFRVFEGESATGSIQHGFEGDRGGICPRTSSSRPFHGVWDLCHPLQENCQNVQWRHDAGAEALLPRRAEAGDHKLQCTTYDDEVVAEEWVPCRIG
jgi:GNAT superfamily N-acetyltransferase